MARLLPNMPLVALAISLLLLSALLARAAAAAAASDLPAKKPGMRIRYANKEEARWLDRYAETHEPLNAGPLRMRRATQEESQWLNRLNSDDNTERADGEDGGRGYIEFDDDNPYVHAVQAWASRLIKEGLEKAQMEDQFQDL